MFVRWWRAGVRSFGICGRLVGGVIAGGIMGARGWGIGRIRFGFGRVSPAQPPLGG